MPKKSWLCTFLYLYASAVKDDGEQESEKAFNTIRIFAYFYCANDGKTNEENKQQTAKVHPGSG